MTALSFIFKRNYTQALLEFEKVDATPMPYNPEQPSLCMQATSDIYWIPFPMPCLGLVLLFAQTWA